jgi:NitT/TauT family transport system permease protein
MMGADPQPGWIAFAIAAWLALWALNVVLAGRARWAVPVVFGVAVVILWEGITRGLGVPEVILPAPSVVARTFAASTGLLWGDFVQTIIRGALPGYAMGCGAALVLAVLIDRSPFLTRGLLPVGNFVAALPIVGIAPIMVTWFGFGWQSKAAVVFAMVFFPVLINTVAGLTAAERMQRDLMRTYAASYWQTLVKLRLPAAMPFVFNGLKIATTLALIGAIVAEFFGSPTRGMGFRISTAVGSLALPLVWSHIVVAALAGTVFFGLVTALERRVTFWHPSHRARK